MWQSLLVYNACPQPQTEATVLVSPSLLQIDTFGKWCRCLHNVCYLKLKKRRYLDKCRLSAPAESTGSYYPKRSKTQLSFSQVEIINHTQNISPRQTSNLGLTLQQLLTRVEAIFLKGIAIINDSQMVVISSNLLAPLCGDSYRQFVQG